MLCFALPPARAQMGQPRLVLQMTERAMSNERWDDAARGWKGILAREDWPYDFNREDAMLNLSTCLQRLARWKEARGVVLPYIVQHQAPSYYTVKAIAHLVAIAYAAEGEAGLDCALAGLLGDRTLFRAQFARFSQQLPGEMGGVYPLYYGMTRWLREHPACSATAELQMLQLELLLQYGENQEAWRLAREGYLDRVGTAADIDLLVMLADINAKLGAPDYAINLLAAFQPVMPDPGNRLAPLLEQYRAQAAQLVERRRLIDRTLPAMLDDPNGTPEKDKTTLEELVKDVPGAVYWVSRALAFYLNERPEHPRRVGLSLAMSGLLSAARDHQAAIDYARALLPLTARTPEEMTVAAFLAEEHAKRGDFLGAGDALLLETSKELAEKIDTKLAALKYYRRGGSVEKVAALVNGLGPNPPANTVLVDAVYWLALAAAATGNVEEVKPWVELLNRVSMEDSRAVAARKLLRELQTGIL